MGDTQLLSVIPFGVHGCKPEIGILGAVSLTSLPSRADVITEARASTLAINFGPYRLLSFDELGQNIAYEAHRDAH